MTVVWPSLGCAILGHILMTVMWLEVEILGIPCSVIPPNASVNGVQNFFPEEFIKRHISGQITTLKGTSFICHISSSSKHTRDMLTG